MCCGKVPYAIVFLDSHCNGRRLQMNKAKKTFAEIGMKVLKFGDIVDICNETDEDLIPNEVLKQMSISDQFEELLDLARYQFCPAEILRKLLKKTNSMSGAERLRWRIAENTNCDDGIFETLLKMDDRLIPVKIAENTSVSPKILECMCETDDDVILMKIAENYNATETVLKKLCEKKSISKEVKLAIIENGNTSEEILKQLCYDSDPYIAFKAAEDLGEDEELFEKAVKRRSLQDLVILAEYTSEPKLLVELSKNGDDDVIINVIRNWYCPRELMEKFSDSEERWHRLEVVKKDNCSIRILRNLADDGEYIVRKAVASNANSPGDLLEKLSYDSSISVREAVACNHNTPDSTLYRMFIEDKNCRVMMEAGKNIKIYWRFDFGLFRKRYYNAQIYGYLENRHVSARDVVSVVKEKFYSTDFWNILNSAAKNPNMGENDWNDIWGTDYLPKPNESTRSSIKQICKKGRFIAVEDFVNYFFE